MKPLLTKPFILQEDIPVKLLKMFTPSNRHERKILEKNAPIIEYETYIVENIFYNELFSENNKTYNEIYKECKELFNDIYKRKLKSRGLIMNSKYFAEMYCPLEIID